MQFAVPRLFTPAREPHRTATPLELLFDLTKARIGAAAALFTTAIPVAVFVGMIYALYYYLVRRFDPLHTWLLLLTASVMMIVGADHP